MDQSSIHLSSNNSTKKSSEKEENKGCEWGEVEERKRERKQERKKALRKKRAIGRKKVQNLNKEQGNSHNLQKWRNIWPSKSDSLKRFYYQFDSKDKCSPHR